MFIRKFDKIYREIINQANNSTLTNDNRFNKIQFIAIAFTSTDKDHTVLTVQNEFKVFGNTVNQCMEKICKKLHITKNWRTYTDFYEVPVQCNTPFTDELTCSLTQPKTKVVYDIIIEKHLINTKTNKDIVYNICQADLYDNQNDTNEKIYTLSELKSLPPMTRVIGSIIILGGKSDNEYQCDSIATVRQWLSAFNKLKNIEQNNNKQIQFQLGRGVDTQYYSLADIQDSIEFQIISPTNEKLYSKYASRSNGTLNQILNLEYV